MHNISKHLLKTSTAHIKHTTTSILAHLSKGSCSICQLVVSFLLSHNMGLSFTKFINESGSLIFATAISNEHTKHSGWSLLRLVEISR